MKKIIDNINIEDILRMDCFSQCICPVIKHYGGRISPLYIMESLHMTNIGNIIECVETRCFSLKDYIKDVGLGIIHCKYIDEENLMIDIKRALNRNMFVICSIDLYFNSTFPAVYLKSHSRHGMLIYGYDDEREVFHVVSIDYVESFTRVKKTMSYSDIINGVKGYVENYGYKYPICSIYNIGEIRNDLLEKYMSIYIEFHYKNRHFELEDNYRFGEYCEYFNNMKNDVEYIKTIARHMFSRISSLVNSRMLEYYGFSKILINSKDITEINEQIVEKANYIRTVFYRTMYLGDYRKLTYEKCSKYLGDIQKLEEKRIYIILNDVCEDNRIKDRYV